MSLTQTTTTTTTTTCSDLQRRLQPSGGQQVRFRSGVTGVTGTTGVTAFNTITTTPTNATLARRFSFVWPFISKENAAGSSLRSRCSQLLRLGGQTDQSLRTVRSVRDLISRVLSQLKAVWLVLAVYLSLVVLTCLCSLVLYTFVLATKPPGLWFLVGCVLATGAIASVSFSARERPQRPQQRQQQQQLLPQQ